MKIVSGGQTGVDRAALDAALAEGADCGGWCPEGRRAEDGRIPDFYPLTELPGGGYAERTRDNVADSDGTLILCFGEPAGGTAATRLACKEQNRAFLEIDAELVDPGAAAESALDFIQRHGINVLNVAGPRATEQPRAYDYARAVVTALLRRLRSSGP